MACLEVVATNFARTVGAGPLEIGYAALFKAAALVGTPLPFRWPAGSRTVREVVWRIAMAHSNLTVRAGRWARSDSFDGLDPSEKGAVSYLLGGVQAQLTAQYSLGFSHLVHVDAIMRSLGIAVAGTRPDFLAVDAASRNYQATVETKGRTHGYTPDTLENAKLQARAHVGLLVPLGGVQEHIASISWFNRDREWQAALDDPDPLESGIEVSIGRALRVYYQPLVDIAQQTGDIKRDGKYVTISVQESGLQLHLPAALFDAVSRADGDAGDAAIEAAFESTVRSTGGGPPDQIVATLRDFEMDARHRTDDRSTLKTPAPSGSYTIGQIDRGRFVWSGEAPRGMSPQYSTREDLLDAIFAERDATVSYDILLSEA